jgi:ADP-ribosylation factor-like protein 6
MGFFKKILNFFGLAKTEKNILIIGLDNAGKSTLINKLKSKKNNKETVPTIGFNKETFSKKNFNFNVFDMSGQQKYRPLWESYYHLSDAVIFVIDSSDRVRLSIVKYEIEQMLQNADLGPKAPLLFFSNKMDLEYAVKPWEIEEELQLSNINNRVWSI